MKRFLVALVLVAACGDNTPGAPDAPSHGHGGTELPDLPASASTPDAGPRDGSWCTALCLEPGTLCVGDQCVRWVDATQPTPDASAPTCDAPLQLCGETCTDLTTTSDCGTCGNACLPEQFCSEALTCSDYPPIPPPETWECYDPTKDNLGCCVSVCQHECDLYLEGSLWQGCQNSCELRCKELLEGL